MDYLPFSGDTPVALVVQADRGDVDFELVRRYHPGAERSPITGLRGEVLAWMVLVNPPPVGRGEPTGAVAGAGR